MSHPIIGDEKPDPETIEFMKKSSCTFPDTRWAAYQNVELGHPSCGHLQFLATGPQNTIKDAPRERLPDFPGKINWRYWFVGFVNLTTGEIEPE